MVAAAIVGGAVIGGVATSYSAKKSASAQEAAGEKAAQVSKKQFNKTVALLKPYTEAGYGSLEAQQDLLGLNGPEAQESAISAIEQGPQYSSLIEQGEEAILQNASATGGLRGGNTQEALARFRPQLLSQLIDQQYSRLAPITALGQASGAQTAAAGQQYARDVGQQYGNIGAARAGQYIAQGQAVSNIGNSVAQAAILNKAGF